MSTRAESTLFKRTMRVLLALAMALYFAPGLLLTPQNAWATPSITGSTATVDNLTDLQTAIANSSVNTIVVTTSIALPDGTIIDGSNKTIQVETPYVNEAGACLDSGYSTHNVFTVNSSGAVVTLKNMTIYGGNASGGNAGGIIVNSGTLKAEGVTIARSYRGLYIGTSAKASLTSCNIVRNVCSNGGGILCNGGTLVMDRCSLSENRSTSSSGGGGAIEVKSSTGKFYANNTVIANNCSSEIGGAVNVYNSSACLMNCTVTGNVTTTIVGDAEYGGGIGINDGAFYAVNSIFLNNKYQPSAVGATGSDSDIGLFSGTADNVKLHHCLYGKISTSVTPDSATCEKITDSTSVFVSPSPKPVTSPTQYPLFAPLVDSGSNPAKTRGAVTYFDKSNLGDVKMSYGDSNTGLGGLPAVTDTASTKVDSYFEGGSRASGVIGASGTVKFEPIPAPPVYIPEPDPTPSVTPSSPTGVDDFGTISGVSDRMEYKLEGADAWTDVPAGVTQLTGLPAGTYLIRYKGYSSYTKVVVAAAPAYSVEVKPATGGTATADKVTAMKGETVTFSATADKGFNLRGWMVGGEFVEADSITMPAGDIIVEPVFTPVQTLLSAQAKASAKSATLSWKPIEGAVKYRVYLAKADGKLKRVTTIEVPVASEGEGNDDAIQAACAYTAKKLKAGTIYKLRVVAVAEDGSTISRSPIAYVTPKGKSYANAAKLSVSKKSISLGTGEKAKVSAKVTRFDSKGKKLLKVSGVKKIRYMSSEPTIVKVTKYGNITALRAGTAYIYAIAADGVYKQIKVSVG